MGKNKPKLKRYQCLIWLQSPVGDSPTPEAIAAWINAAFAQADIKVYEHLDAQLGTDTGDYYSTAIVEGMGINPARLQDLLAHLGTPQVLLLAVKATAPSEVAAQPESRLVIRLDQKELGQG